MTDAIGSLTSRERVPRVSVLMTVYNDRPDFVSKAIESILDQTFSNFEFLILSDGTTRNETTRLLKQAATRDARIRLFWEPHRGLVKSLNVGLRYCRGELICRQDADDWSEPQRIESQIGFLDKYSSIAVVGTAFELCQEMGHRLWIQRPPCDPDQILKSFYSGNPFCHGSTCFRAFAARDVGGYNERLSCTEDYDFFWRLCERFGGANLPNALYHHRRSPGSIVGQLNDQLVVQRISVVLLAQQRARGEAEDLEAVKQTAQQLVGKQPNRFLLGLADQQLLAGHYFASLRSYMLAIVRAPHVPLAYFKALRWFLFVIAPTWRARLFGQRAA